MGMNISHLGTPIRGNQGRGRMALEKREQGAKRDKECEGAVKIWKREQNV